MDKATIGIIGGSGLYELDGLKEIGWETVDTPYGPPSDQILLAKLGDAKLAFLPRHGRGHRLNPTHVPYQANIYALKKLGVKTILSVSAVGSLKEEIEPLHFVVPDQVIDRTKHRPNTFFDPIAVHVGFGDPFCNRGREVVVEAGRKLGHTVHDGGTYVCMEGPVFSSRAESELYRSWGASVIGMTAIPEVKLAREAELCYVTIACSTDYDCWHTSDEVSADLVLEHFAKNIANVKQILLEVLPKLAEVEEDCPCQNALQTAMLTPQEMIPKDKKEAFSFLLGKYWKK